MLLLRGAAGRPSPADERRPSLHASAGGVSAADLRHQPRRRGPGGSGGGCGAEPSTQILLPACTLGICLNVDRGEDQALDSMDVWNHIDADRDGALSTDELLPLLADITSLSVGVVLVGLVGSVLSTSGLAWRLRSLAASHEVRQRWQATAQADLRRIEAEREAAEGSVSALSKGAMTKSGKDTERQIQSLEDELQELTEPDDDDGEACSESAVTEPPLKLKRSISEKDRAMLQERLRQARAEKATHAARTGGG